MDNALTSNKPSRIQVLFLANFGNHQSTCENAAQRGAKKYCQPGSLYIKG